ncbi:hypothetical protein AB0395_33135 [Streptosporangium sp. NPDC051023]|uniref:hypothetical protein n=1 Tax=Streptosporangium sp. NPDC051023 TaxID=3155410 RepID=UPI00344B4DB1
MGLIEAGAWGIAGGLAAGLLTLMVAVTEARFRWPWKEREQVWGHMFVIGGGMVLGALVAGAAHGQMSGAWPAFIMGVGAPSIVRGLLSRIEVNETKDEEPTPRVTAKADVLSKTLKTSQPADVTVGGDAGEGTS